MAVLSMPDDFTDFRWKR